MAGRIKGITVEIGGDTTGLDKALKGVNSTFKNAVFPKGYKQTPKTRFCQYQPHYPKTEDS